MGRLERSPFDEFEEVTRVEVQPMDGGEGVVEHEDGGGGLADAVNTILDKGFVIAVFARGSLVGIELLRLDARVVVASVDTYLRFAEAAGRLGVGSSEPAGLPSLVGDIQSAGPANKPQAVPEGRRTRSRTSSARRTTSPRMARRLQTVHARSRTRHLRIVLAD